MAFCMTLGSSNSGEIVADNHQHGAPPLFSFLVAGCDRGLDAYSLCITLLEEAKTHAGLDFSILATDFLPANLNQAKRGVYSWSSVRDLPQDLLKRYFLRSRGSGTDLVRVKPGVRARVNFRCQDIFEPFALREPMDVIVCRQVLHHFHPGLALVLAGRLRGQRNLSGARAGILEKIPGGAHAQRMPGFRQLGHAFIRRFRAVEGTKRQISIYSAHFCVYNQKVRIIVIKFGVRAHG
jgi:chemotaxis protein methyltransferase CheR